MNIEQLRTVLELNRTRHFRLAAFDLFGRPVFVQLPVGDGLLARPRFQPLLRIRTLNRSDVMTLLILQTSLSNLFSGPKF